MLFIKCIAFMYLVLCLYIHVFTYCNVLMYLCVLLYVLVSVFGDVCMRLLYCVNLFMYLFIGFIQCTYVSMYVCTYSLYVIDVFCLVLFVYVCMYSLYNTIHYINVCTYVFTDLYHCMKYVLINVFMCSMLAMYVLV